MFRFFGFRVSVFGFGFTVFRVKGWGLGFGLTVFLISGFRVHVFRVLLFFGVRCYFRQKASWFWAFGAGYRLSL